MSLKDDNGMIHQGIDWDSLLKDQANFKPVLDSDLDTSHFDPREDRYPGREASDEDDDNDDNDTSPQLGQFQNFSCVALAQTPTCLSPGSSSPSSRNSPSSPAFRHFRFGGSRPQSPQPSFFSTPTSVTEISPFETSFETDSPPPPIN